MLGPARMSVPKEVPEREGGVEMSTNVRGIVRIPFPRSLAALL